jgi:arylsulfatase A
MKRFSFLLIAACLLTHELLGSTSEAAGAPNIVLLLADDLGYGDLGCYGATEISTPRLDRLAREGVRCIDFYSAAPFCSPSRAALLTGRLPARCGLPYVLFPAEHTGLPPEEITLAELLRQHGYRTACIGKWHLGWDRRFRPTEQGFDKFFGLPYSNDSFEWPLGQPFQPVMGLEPLPLMDGPQAVEAPVDQSTLTERYTAKAIDFIRANRARPFLLYLPHAMPHIPQHASAAFAGKSRAGLYGDVVEELDASVGAIVDVLVELEIAANTLIVFTSDNGGVVRNMASRSNAASRFPGRDFGGSNGVLRAGKGTTWEGGVRVPAICWWPGRIPGGQELHEPLSMMDLFPTVASLAGVELPTDRVFDGQNIIQRLTGDQSATPAERTLYHYFGVQLQAVRRGRWKLIVPIAYYPDPRPVSLWFEHQPQLFERQHRLWPKPALYDLGADPSERNDIAAEHADIVQQLLTAAQRFDAALQADRRPQMFVEGPEPPKPGQVRRESDDLSVWRMR